MQKLLIATTNPGKIKEICFLLSDLPLHLVTLKDAGISLNVEEIGKTYKENSQRKALFYSRLSGLASIADDGGLEIDALNNQPGIKSRRWLGYSATDDELMRHMSQIAESLPNSNRKAQFVVVITFALPSGETWSTKGMIRGVISEKPYMNKIEGYPYRSFFYLPRIKKYYQDELLTANEQEAYNHRYKAIKKIKNTIKKKLVL